MQNLWRCRCRRVVDPNRELYSNDDGMARKTSLKINTGAIVTIFDCPILFAFYFVGKVRFKWSGVHDVKLNAGNKRFVVLCSSCHQDCK